MAAHRARPGEPRAVPRAARRGRARRGPLPRDLPVNLASPDDELYEKSVATLETTMDVACAIEADGVVFHVGSHLGAGFEAGLERAVPALGARSSGATTDVAPLENSAGTGGTIGRSIDELAAIFRRVDHPRLGLCLDSCHLWVSGVDVTDPAAVDAMVARGGRDDRPRPAPRPARERRGRGSARLEPRPPREHRRGRHRQGARGVPRPPARSGTSRGRSRPRARTATARTRPR